MRISDCISDVCSSDLLDQPGTQGAVARQATHGGGEVARVTGGEADAVARIQEELARAADAGGHHRRAAGHGLEGHQAEGLLPLAGEDERIGGPVSLHQARSVDRPRSEEHTSELQSLMRISYAVF